jgi:hypothetical protein
MTILARVKPTWPIIVQGTGGVTVSQSRGRAVIGFDYENSELGAELKQAVDSADADAAATAADRVQTGQDVVAAQAAQAAAEAAAENASANVDTNYFGNVAAFEAATIGDAINRVYIASYYSAVFGNPGSHWCKIQDTAPSHYAYHVSSNGKYAVIEQDYLTFEMFGGKAFTTGEENAGAFNKFMSYAYATGRSTLNFSGSNYYFKERPWAYHGNSAGIYGLNIVGAGKEMTRIYCDYAEDDDHGFFHVLPNHNGGQYNVRDLSILSTRTTFGGCAIYAIDGNRTDVTLSGTITAGDTISVNIRYSSTDHIATYTVQSGDDLNVVADALDLLIRQNSTLRDTDGFRTAVYDNILFIIGNSTISTTISVSTSDGATISGAVGTTNLYTCGYLHFQNIDISSSNGWTFPIYIDGDRHPGSPQGLRSTYLLNVQAFGGLTASAVFKGVVHLSLVGCETVQAGGSSGNLYISGKSGAYADTISIVCPQVGGDLSLDYVQQVVISIGEIAGDLVLDHVNNVNINVGLIASDIANTSNTNGVSVCAKVAGSVQTNWVNSHIVVPGDVVTRSASQSLSSKTVAFLAGTTSKPPINLQPGTAPSSPADGDFWYDGTNLKFRVGGTTKTVTLT